MALELLGNYHFTNVPAADTSAEPWAAAMDRCAPSFKLLARVGLSAAATAISQAPNPQQTLAMAAEQPLFDAQGRLTETSNDIAHALRRSRHEFNLFSAGIGITGAALAATRVFHEIPATIEDYTGPFGDRSIRRRAELSDLAVGSTMYGYRVKNVQAHIQSSAGPNPKSAELTFAAPVRRIGALPLSFSSHLEAEIVNEQASARVSSATREGDFVRPDSGADFMHLLTYADLIIANMPS